MGRLADLRQRSRGRRALRTGSDGKLRLDPDGQLPRDLDKHIDLKGVAGNFWLGLALLHTLFMHEHNAICDRAARRASDVDGRRALRPRRALINAALMAKIHTVEWTPALITHPTTKLRDEGELVGPPRQTLTGIEQPQTRCSSGIPGSEVNHHGVPYSLTEEFVAVYRMHPLIPDDFTFRSVEDDRELSSARSASSARWTCARGSTRSASSTPSTRSAIAHPGAITLHNYPRFLQEFHKADGTVVDLAATDILRIRERGVPRYNEFRAAVPPASRRRPSRS